MVGILLNPFVVWFSISSEENLSRMLDFIRNCSVEHVTLGKLCRYSIFDKRTNLMDELEFGLGK